MKKRNVNVLKLTKESISKLDQHKSTGGRTDLRPPASTQGGCGSQHNSQCGYSCDPNLCGSVEPWGCGQN
ncbi:hypothetical protein [Kordia jejudonensis]|uniref:hypothetical protein n=1 Tax=Kordia jejudonensis TaxID=1348245 RepID=UPI0006299CFB|nr:hypothetical protein [Kordia jejudonensis]